jgi:hypothetical protein
MAKQMVAKQFNAKKFYYLKINPKANEIEMRFLTRNILKNNLDRINKSFWIEINV